MRLLTHPCHALAGAAGAVRIQLLPIDHNLPRLHSHQARQLCQQYGLATATGAAQCHMLTGLHAKAQRRQSADGTRHLHTEIENLHLSTAGAFKQLLI